MSDKFVVGLAQVAPKLGDVQANLEQHLRIVEEGLSKGIDLLIFPELSLAGYTLRDIVPHVAIQPSADHPVWSRLLEESKRLALVVGFVEEDARHRFYNSVAFLDGGETIHVHRKVYLPTYGLFEESRYFAAGAGLRSFDTRFGRFGIAICEDSWHISTPYVLWLGGADFLILCSASPGYGVGTEQGGGTDNGDIVQQFSQTYARLLTSFVFQVNRTGVEEGIPFWGGSMAVSPGGAVLAQGPYFEDALVMVEVDHAMLRAARQRLPLLRDERFRLVARELSHILSVEDDDGR